MRFSKVHILFQILPLFEDLLADINSSSNKCPTLRPTGDHFRSRWQPPQATTQPFPVSFFHLLYCKMSFLVFYLHRYDSQIHTCL